LLAERNGVAFDRHGALAPQSLAEATTVSTGQDDDRPPVLAHLRFVAQRSAFSGLDLAERFRRIHRTNLWGAAGSVSGLGSENDATAGLRQQLPRLLCRLGATSLVDAPCGDGGWIAALDIGLSYTGVDIVPELIDDLRGRAEQAGLARSYLLADITRDPLPRADAILCRDCLVHLSFANIAAALTNFRRSGSEWLVTTTFPELKANTDCEDGDWRALNFELAPFYWGPPAELLVEGCTEGGGGWADKSLAAWRIATLPRQFEQD
jgi:SAM-dependent methyltransferase